MEDATVRAYLGLGANVGDRLAGLRSAVRLIGEDPSCRLLATSSVYETKPVGPVDQPDFLNAVIEIETMLTPKELLDLVHNTEKRLGRERTIRWGPRVIDIDILLYDEIELRVNGLTIPHPEMVNRAFVLVPLAEIAPNTLIAPGLMAAEAARRIEQAGIQKTSLRMSC